MARAKEWRRWAWAIVVPLSALALAGACSDSAGLAGGAGGSAAGEEATVGGAAVGGTSAQGGRSSVAGQPDSEIGGTGQDARGGAGADAASGGDAAGVAGGGAPDPTTGGAAVGGAASVCFVDGNCELGQQCNGTQPAKVCVAQDEYCAQPSDCGRRAVCANHRCQAPLPEGAACTSGMQCVLGTTCLAAAGGDKCLPSFHEGQVCDQGFDYSSGQPVPVEGMDAHCPPEAPCRVGDEIGDDTWYCIGTGDRDTRGCTYGCAPTSFCSGADRYGDGGSCEPKHAAKGDCFYDGDCEAGLSCGAGYGTDATWTYAICVQSPALGESCVFSQVIDQPALGTLTVTCAAGSYCADDGVCHKSPQHAQACGDLLQGTYGSGPAESHIECAPGLKCIDSWSNGTCQ